MWRYSLVLVAGCVGEAAVSYQGTVTEGPVAGYEFATVANPTGGAPVAGATVQLCVDDRCGAPQTVDSTGAYGELEQVFGGFAGHDTRITVTASAADRRVEYTTIYEDTSDPTVANGSCSTPCPSRYLSFVLAP